ncbi:hypothetical protein ACSNOJ_20840 [Streptomyces sp. URMC 128]|uniref:hypothetical protein n=1 Tax=Streptomyces sp. URMC 128 TaxID=3423404 RepID=UPI003F1B84DC
MKTANGAVTAMRTLAPDGAAPSWPETASGDTGDPAVVRRTAGYPRPAPARPPGSR